MGEMAETNLKGLIHLITTTKDSFNMLFASQAAAGVPLLLAYMENADCALFLMKQHSISCSNCVCCKASTCDKVAGSDIQLKLKQI